MLILTLNHDFRYETEKLLRVFFPDEKILIQNKENDNPCDRKIEALILREGCWQRYYVRARLDGKELVKEKIGDVSDGSDAELAICTVLFQVLVEFTKYQPKWGLLTGVRPAKLMNRLIREADIETAKNYFREQLFVSPEKTNLAIQVCQNQNQILMDESGCFSLYIAIPFCPTRCSYCSFVSHSIAGAKHLLDDYLRLLCQELQITAEIAANLGLKLKSIYVGGGTPTVLSAGQMDTLLSAVNRYFHRDSTPEFTVEAGRPDTITAEKLSVIRQNGVDRISINPQTFHDNILAEIGRNHTVKQTLDAYEEAVKAGFQIINMDLIAGLPKDTPQGFRESLEQTIALSPANITIHTLALKRASSLALSGQTSFSADTAAMLDFSEKKLKESGYQPYYMYRQSKTVGNLENVGWATSGTACLYNIYMMEEIHSVFACGAGAVTKLKRDASENLERIFNFKYPYEYIARFDQILERKRKILAFYS